MTRHEQPVRPGPGRCACAGRLDDGRLHFPGACPAPAPGRRPDALGGLFAALARLLRRP